MTHHQYDKVKQLQRIWFLQGLFGKKRSQDIVTKQAEIELAGKFSKLVWLMKTMRLKVRAWRRRHDSELRELDMFRKCRRLERKLSDYPRAVPLLTELMKAYRETGQEARRLEVMRRLRDIEPKPVPDFMWDEQPPVKVWRNNIDAWCAKIERLVKERCMTSIHLRHIENVLHVSCGNATMVCAALQNRGVLGPYDMATGRNRVLIGREE